jgi:phosphatidate phosphatase PAH1
MRLSLIRSEKYLPDLIVYISNHQPVINMDSKEQSASSTEKSCNHCKRPLHGRSDQRFFNDTCRNTYIRIKLKEQKLAAHENAPEIIKIIKKNYDLLKSLHKQPLTREMLSIPAKKLQKENFNPKFYTSSFTDEQGTTWNCLFEHCYAIGDESAFVQDFPIQAEL